MNSIPKTERFLNKWILVLATLGSALTGSAQAQDEYSIKTFEAIPRAAEAPQSDLYWSGSYLPELTGGIKLARSKGDLSFVEKVNLFLPSQHFEALLKEHRGKHLIPSYWQGFCDGWALASRAHPLPTDRELISPSGQRVHFSSNEIQALYSFIYSYYASDEDSQYYGDRCTTRQMKEGMCSQLNPIQFHFALGRYLGRQEGFLPGFLAADIYSDQRVSNHPILAYETTQTEIQTHEPGERVFEIETRVTYLAYYVFKFGSMQENGKPAQKKFQKTYRYRITFGAKGYPIHADWLSSHPELLWTPKKLPTLNQDWQWMKDL